jgi:LiaF transmembrane domain
MRVRPGLLFWGIFFILLGAVPLLVRAGALDPTVVADLWRLWPLLLIALGVAVILGRSRAGILGTIVAATALGLAAGGLLASGTGFIGNIGCGPTPTDQHLEQAGTFEGSTSAVLDLNCGTLDVSMAPGNAWQLKADYRGAPPSIDVSDAGFKVRSPEGIGPHRQAWTVSLPADQTDEMHLTANAATVTARLASARFTSFDGTVNAGDVRIDATGAHLDDIDLTANAARVRLGVDSDTKGRLSANAGSMDLCVPSDATLRLRVQEQLTFAHNLDDRGLAHSGDVWTRQGAVGAPVIDLEIEGNAASFTLDPQGGC